MWQKCPTNQDDPVTIPYFNCQLQDVYLGSVAAALGFFLLSPLHGLGIGVAVVAVLTILKHGRAPGWMMHVLHAQDLWIIPGARRVDVRHYTIWHS